MTESLGACRFCGSDRVGVRYPHARDYIGGEVFSILACENCGAGVTHPLPPDLDAYYPPTYRAYRGPILNVLNWIYKAKARRWSRLFDRPGNLLQVGCGPGMLLNSMRGLGWSVLGLERSEEAATLGREQFGLDVRAGDIDRLPPGERFDFIILFQVLEHMRDPVGVIDACYARLNPGGRIAIGIPNFASWQSRFGRELWVHLDVPRHTSHFSPEALRHLLRLAGFEKVEIGYVSVEHDPFGWIQTMLNRVISPPNTLMRHLMRLDAPMAKVYASIVLAAILAVPSAALSLVSWIAGEGALMSVIARRPG